MVVKGDSNLLYGFSENERKNHEQIRYRQPFITAEILTQHLLIYLARSFL